METSPPAGDTFATHTIPPDAAGLRLDQWLAASFPQHSRSRWQDLVKSGAVTLNLQAAKPNAKLRVGDQVSYQAPAPKPLLQAAAQDIPLSILYEDADLVVIDKPAGMVVHPAAGNWDGTLVNALLHHCGELSLIGGEHRPGIVHRLDKETSGCLVVAKNDFSHHRLARQFAGRTVRKIYLALAAGRFAKKSGLVEAAIGRHPVDRKKMTVLQEGQGRAREARTSWRVVQEIAVKDAPAGLGSVVECTLHTGRTHQIRVHLKHLGHPLLGDELYGRPAGFARQMLHAWRLGFTHPRTEREVTCVAPLPEDFSAAGIMTPES